MLLDYYNSAALFAIKLLVQLTPITFFQNTPLWKKMAAKKSAPQSIVVHNLLDGNEMTDKLHTKEIKVGTYCYINYHLVVLLY